MAHNLTLTSPVFDTNPVNIKWGSGSLTSGTGIVALALPADVTFECWYRTGFYQVAPLVQKVNSMFMGTGYPNSAKPGASYPVSGGEVTLSGPDEHWTAGGSPPDPDLVHIVLTLSTTTGSQLFVNGALVATSATNWLPDDSLALGIGCDGSGGGDTGSKIMDEVAIWTGIKYTSSALPTGALIADDAVGLLALWHMDGDGTDSATIAAPPATAITAITTPNTATAPVLFSGTYTGPDPTALNLRYDSDAFAGSFTPLYASGGVFTVSTLLPADGTHTVSIRDNTTHVGVTSAAFLVGPPDAVVPPTVNPITYNGGFKRTGAGTVPTETLAPNAPTGLRLAAIGPNKLTLGWVEAGPAVTTRTANKRLAGTGSYVTAAVSNSRADTSQGAPAGARLLDVNGLASSTAYDLQLVLGNTGGSVNATLLNSTTAAAVTGGGPITDITWTPFGTDGFAGAGYGAWLGRIAPVGGTGPFVYVATTGPASDPFKVVPTVYPNGGPHGTILYYSGAFDTVGPDSITVQIIEKAGTGTSFTKTIALEMAQSSSLPQIYFCGPETVGDNFQNFQTYQDQDHTWTVNGAGTTGTLSISGPGPATGLFYISGGPNAYTISANNPLPIGDYAFTFTCDAVTLNKTISVVAHTPIPPIVFVPNALSSTNPPGTLVGTAYGTVGNNHPVWTLADNVGGKYAINSDTGQVTTLAALTAGTDALQITILEYRSPTTRTDLFNLTVVPGNVLASSNMTMTPRIDLPDWETHQQEIVGTPAVTGISGTKVWSMTQPVEERYSSGVLKSHKKYAIDPATGQISNYYYNDYYNPDTWTTLQAGTDVLTVTCTNGIDTCTRAFNVVIPETIGPTYYIGEGMAALHGAFGFEHMVDVKPFFMDRNTIGPRVGAYLKIYSNPDPNYYANDVGTASLRYTWQGPFKMEGFQGSGSGAPPQPRMGGTLGVGLDGTGYDGKAYIVCGNGRCQFKNLEVSWVHGDHPGDYNADWPRTGVSCLRKDGETWGDMVITDCYLHDSDNCVQPDSWDDTLLTNTEIHTAGGATVGVGNTHGIYCIGRRLLLLNCIFHHCTKGHMVKSRAQITDVLNNRIFDGETGNASSCIDICNGGVATVTGNTVHKGPSPNNANLVNYFAEGGADDNGVLGNYWPINTLFVGNNTFINNSPSGLHFGPGLAVNWWPFANQLGVLSAVVVGNNSYSGFPTGALVGGVAPGRLALAFSNPPAAFVESGTPTYLVDQPALDFAPPNGRPAHASPLWHFFVLDESDTYTNYSYVQIRAGSEDLRISHTATVGTQVAAMSGYGIPYAAKSSSPQPDIRINPFVAGTTWAIVRDPTYYSTVPWAPVGRYVINNSTGIVTVAGGLVAGVDLIRVRATAPNGTLAERYFYICVT